MKRIVAAFVFALCISAQLSAQEADSAQANPEKGVIALSVAYIRSAPDYESSLETQALMGCEVEILGREGYWLNVRTADPQYEGWVTELAVAPLPSSPNASFAGSTGESVAAERSFDRLRKRYVCTALLSHAYEKPSEKSGIVSEIILCDEFSKALTPGGKPIVKGNFAKIILPDGREGWVKRTAIEDNNLWLSSLTSSGEAVASAAQRLLGIPYLWGGNCVKGMDCSGLTWLCFRLAGVSLPRNASAQARLGTDVPIYDTPPTAECTVFDFSALRPGDLIFFGKAADGDQPARVTHVAISLGGTEFIHSSQVVRRSSLNPLSPIFYEREPLFARRLL